MIIDGQSAGLLMVPNIPPSTYTDMDQHIFEGYSPIGPPMVASDGFTYVEYEVRTIAYPPQVTSAELWLMKIYTNNLNIDRMLLASTTSDENLFPGRIIPDGQGGVIATWRVHPGTGPLPQYPFKAVRVSASGTVGMPFDLPFSPTSFILDDTGLAVNPMLALGETNTFFVSYGDELVSMSTSGSVVRFTSGGTPSADGYTGVGLDHYVAEYWTGTGGGTLNAFFASSVDLATTGYASPTQKGTNKGVPSVTVTNPSQTGDKQQKIRDVFATIKLALQNEATEVAPSPPTCSNFLPKVLTMIDILLPPSGPETVGHGVVELKNEQGQTNKWQIAAFKTGGNPDRSPTGVPAGWLLTFNDRGAFYNGSAGGGDIAVGLARYKGNTPRAQAEIVLHELAHMVVEEPLFLPDFGNNHPGAKLFNDIQIVNNCGALSERKFPKERWFHESCWPSRVAHVVRGVECRSRRAAD
jgi:hypothetical protein